jgi:hypothetical protein
VEVIHSCLDQSVEGLILPQLRTGLFHIPAYIDYGYSIQKLMDDPGVQETKGHLLQSHRYFEQAKRIHDDWERVYTEHTDYEALNRFTKETVQQVLGEKRRSRKGNAVHRFFGAATELGAVDQIPNLTETVGKRYFIEGRPGTGKSTFLKKLADHFQSAGFDVEVYHCAFDPPSLDMVIVRDFDVCFFDCTAPHRYTPERENDEILDLYSVAVEEGTDERFAEKIAGFQSCYKDRMEQGRLEISAANQVKLEREMMIDQEVNRAKIDHVMQKIKEKLFFHC